MTVSVTPDGSGDYTSLEAAVEGVPEGSTIILEAGTFLLTEPLSVTKALSLVGAGMDQTEIVSDAEGGVVRFSGDGTFSAEGITFRHEGVATADVVLVEGGEIDFNLCRFTGAIRDEEQNRGGVGLWIQESTTGRVRECRADGNALAGIYILNQAQVTLEGNMVTDNEYTGIIVKDQAQPTLEGNIVSGNGTGGLWYIGDAGGVARDNDCSGNGGQGIMVWGRAQPTLEGNVCKDNDSYGIAYADNASGVARGNECSGNGFGIAVTEPANPELADNNLHDNSDADIQDWR